MLIAQIGLLKKDIILSVSMWRFWIYLGWEDIAKQYRRSFLGPLWISLNSVVFVVAFGLIGSQLFRISVQDYLPYFCLGHIFFGFLSSLINDGCHTFTAAEAFLKQTPYPKCAFAMRVIWRNIIMLGHNLPIALAVLWWAGKIGTILFFWFLAGFFAVALSGVLLVALLGAISARFRDIPMIIGSIMQISFFITPVMWKPDQVTERAQVLVRFRVSRDPVTSRRRAVTVRCDEKRIHSCCCVFLVFRLHRNNIQYTMGVQ